MCINHIATCLMSHIQQTIYPLIDQFINIKLWSYIINDYDIDWLNWVWYFLWFHVTFQLISITMLSIPKSTIVFFFYSDLLSHRLTKVYPKKSSTFHDVGHCSLRSRRSNWQVTSTCPNESYGAVWVERFRLRKFSLLAPLRGWWRMMLLVDTVGNHV